MKTGFNPIQPQRKGRCLYRPEGGRFVEIRQDCVQLCGYDKCAAALMSVFSRWTDFVTPTCGDQEPWLKLSKRQLRDDMMGLFADWSINRAISVLRDLGILKVKEQDDIGGRNSYLFLYEQANALLKDMEIQGEPPKRIPNNRKGWVAMKSAACENADGEIFYPACENADDVRENATGRLRKRSPYALRKRRQYRSL
jgi:hypothetical protein